MSVETEVRTSKREFLSRVAHRTQLPARTVGEVYEAILDELREAVARGEIVVLTSFGRFYRQDHKGHKVRFGRSCVADYPVLKFSASRVVNRSLDEVEPDQLESPDSLEPYEPRVAAG